MALTLEVSEMSALDLRMQEKQQCRMALRTLAVRALDAHAVYSCVLRAAPARLTGGEGQYYLLLRHRERNPSLTTHMALRVSGSRAGSKGAQALVHMSSLFLVARYSENSSEPAEMHLLVTVFPLVGEDKKTLGLYYYYYYYYGPVSYRHSRGEALSFQTKNASGRPETVLAFEYVSLLLLLLKPLGCTSSGGKGPGCIASSLSLFGGVAYRVLLEAFQDVVRVFTRAKYFYVTWTPPGPIVERPWGLLCEAVGYLTLQRTH